MTGGLMMIQKPNSFYFKHGSKGIILLHAFASNPNDVRMLGRRLERQNYSVYAPMFTGHGTGDFIDILANGSVKSWCQDTQRAIEFMKSEKMDSISIFGISLGGIFATWALEHNPDLLMGGEFGSPIISDDHFNVHNLFMSMAKANYQKYQVNEQIAATKLKWLEENVDKRLTEIAQFAHQVANDLDLMKQPYFVGQGLADEVINPNSGQRVVEVLPANQVTFHTYHAGHMLTVNSAHQQLENDLSEFINQNYK